MTTCPTCDPIVGTISATCTIERYNRGCPIKKEDTEANRNCCPDHLCTDYRLYTDDRVKEIMKEWDNVDPSTKHE
jgi:hypothetical protein